MSDRLFFPLILIAAVILALLAVREDKGRLPTGPVGGADTDYSRIMIADTNLNRITRSPLTEIILLDQDGTKYLQIGAITTDLPENPAESAHFRLAADIETQFEGHTLRVIVTARSVGDLAARSFEVNYSAGKSGQSGWKVFDLARDFRSYSFETRVARASGQGVDYLGLRPIASDGIRIVEIKSIVFERLDRWDTGDGA